jgi:AraC-like DNA-binding protein
MSGRSLQRRLAEEDRRFDVLLDEVRSEFAKRYLAKGTVSASEVAFLIGFQSPTAFFRAFKRWTGATPGNFALAGRATPAAAKSE